MLTMTDFRIIPRSEWGAKYDNGVGSAPLPAGESWLHHSATVPLNDDYEAIRKLEAIGEQRFGSGISYTWLFTLSGRIFEGHSPHRQGTHTGGRNDVSRALCLVGNYQDTDPTEAQLRAVAWLLWHAVGQGWLRTPQLRGGHRDVRPMTGDSIITACPGDRAYRLIPIINAMALDVSITGDDSMVDWNIAYKHGRTGIELKYGDWIGETNVAANAAAARSAAVEAKLDALSAKFDVFAGKPLTAVLSLEQMNEIKAAIKAAETDADAAAALRLISDALQKVGE
jgi:hypothetical protein